ncbi:MAG: phosphate/phosphite/phosphonate ABC transporter substrate-binding protein [Anaerolineae bacterium]|nr:phosphate/phosphite/phosphonate ABC transporter substrate-binding protein [Anaerolineae bacterium]
MYRLKLLSVLIAATLILAVVGQVNVPVAAQTDEAVVWAFVPSENSQEVLASADAIAKLVTEKTNIPIKTFVATEFAGVVEAMCNGQAQMGALNTFGYVLASSRDCADVGLVSVRNGSTSYRGQIITLATSGIKTLADLKGKTFCRPDPLSTSGWIIPSILLKANGINVDTDIKVTDVGGHDAVVENVYNGNCDAGATFDDARGQVADKYPDVLDKVVVIDYSAAIPNDTVSFAPAFDKDKRAAIVKALLDIVGDKANADLVKSVYNWTGLAEAQDAFFDDFRQQLDSAGVKIDDLVPTPKPEATMEATAEATP